jgi:hypothetical protein
MKKVLQPAEQEHAIYYSDFSGKLFDQFVPVTVKIECDYGSEYDGSRVELHLSDKGLKKLLVFLKENLSNETKEELKRQLENNCTKPKSNYNNKEIYRELI